MKVLLVYAHPQPSSFNHALKEVLLQFCADNQYEFILSDLYAMNFKANADWNDFTKNSDHISKQYSIAQQQAGLNHQLRADIQAEQKKLMWCDVVVFQFPFWWFGVPAILKGWFDRIFAMGFAYQKGSWFSTVLLKPRRAMLSLTTQSSFAAYQPEGMHGPMDAYLHPITHTLQFVGLEVIKSFVAYDIMSFENDVRKTYLLEYRQHLSQFVK